MIYLARRDVVFQKACVVVETERPPEIPDMNDSIAMTRAGPRLLRIALLSLLGLALLLLAVLVYQGRRHPSGNPEYVALGSSFAAGFGLGKMAPKSPIICFRSVNGYPQQLARKLGLPLVDMSCSGSTADDILTGGQFFQGPQLAAVGPATLLVTLTSGGNDISYIGDLIAMSYGDRGDLKRWAVSLVYRAPHSAAQRNIPRVEAELRAIIRTARRRAPKARIVVATYPAVLPAHGTCPALGLTATQAVLMRGVADQLAQATRTAARAQKAILVDMAKIGAAHDACSRDPWANGARPRAGKPFHPTLAGATATAEHIARALRSEGKK